MATEGPNGVAGALLRCLREEPKLLDIAERNRFAESLESLCHRFAKAQPSANKALKALRQHLEYREEHDVNALARLSAQQVFKSREAQAVYNRQMPHGLLGCDGKGRPVLYKHLGRMNLSDLARKGADLATTLRYNEWLTERLCHSMRHLGQWTVIIDVKGISLSQCTSSKLLLYIKSLASHDAVRACASLDVVTPGRCLVHV